MRTHCDACYNRRAIEGVPNAMCTRCGVAFRPSRGKPNLYCSTSCRYAPRVPIACAYCGGTRNVKPFQVERAAYCSKGCWYSDRHKQNATIGPEPPPVEGARWIRLTQGYFALVDAADYERLCVHSWCARKKTHGIYAARFIEPRRPKFYMHAEVLGDPECASVDHINSDTLDNRSANLRAATPGEQMCNTRKRSNCTSIYKGVFKSNEHTWLARIQKDHKGRHIGSFRTEGDAALAYDAKARELHREFARLNFPLPGEQPAIREAI